MAQPTARITSEHLHQAQFQGQGVRAVGKLVSVDAASERVQLQLVGPDGTPPTMINCPAEQLEKFHLEEQGKGYYEVIGTLNADGTITQYQAVFMGENLDMGLYEEMVKLTHQYPDIF